jgi:hypothetical protein
MALFCVSAALLAYLKAHLPFGGITASSTSVYLFIAGIAAAGAGIGVLVGRPIACAFGGGAAALPLLVLFHGDNLEQLSFFLDPRVLAVLVIFSAAGVYRFRSLSRVLHGSRNPGDPPIEDEVGPDCEYASGDDDENRT